MTLDKTEGIILRSIPFKDYDQIITVYTPDCGLLSAIVKAARSRRLALSSAISPLNRVDLVLKSGRQDLHTCREIAVLDHHLSLRENSERLRGACDLAQAIRTSQLPEKPSPELYHLLQKMIARISESPSISSLVASFRLKIARHDGLLHLSPRCSTCQAELEDPHFFKGEPFCRAHCPTGGMRFAKEGFESLKRLAEPRRFQEIESVPVPQELAINVKSLFEIIYL